MGLILASIRLTLIIMLIAILFPIQFLIVRIAPEHYSAIPMFFHRTLLNIMGIRVHLRGTAPSEAEPTLFVSNHCSYLDIVILSSLLPVSFVAKSEIAGWPLFGSLAKLQQTVFINRRRSNAGEHVDAVAEALRAERNLVLFPEGTSGDGNRVLPFKSTLFRVADITVDEQPVTVQPVCMVPVEINGLPVGRLERPLFCWYGDMDMVSHLWALLGLSSVHVTVEFFPAIARSQFVSHKDMSQYCHQVISNALCASMSGKPVPQPALPPVKAPVNPQISAV